MKFNITIQLDTETTGFDPNTLGELLREIFFKKHRPEDYGCYSTMDWADNVDALDPLDKWPSWFANEDDVEFIRPCRGSIDLNDCTVECMWYWDGDGILAFIIYNGDPDDANTEKLIIINNDCKKDYTWKMVVA